MPFASVSVRRRPLAAAATLVVLFTLLLARPLPAEAAVPSGFRDYTVLSGLTAPTTLEFADDGRVFVAEKSGVIKVFDSLADTTPTVFADLRTNVYNASDRGLLGLALHPDFPATPQVFVLYTFDGDIGGAAPKYGNPGQTNDTCPVSQCIVSGRLSRLTASGNTMTGAEQVLISDWCQQYTSHSIGALAFGPDGALYASAGDGASFSNVDYGQGGSPSNPCGDPPGGVGGAMTPPTAEGGALRSQDLRTSGDPLTLDGTVIRVDPATGAGLPTNPLFSSGDPNARRVIAHGLRNPFRFTFRPGTSEIFLGEVGWTRWEEVNRIANPTDATVENFGWPCYEGGGRQSGYDGANLNVCETLYTQGGVTAPFYTWDHGQEVVAGDGCGTGSSSASGVAFYPGGMYPDSYDGALFFADYSRDCIWSIRRNGSGALDPATRATFVTEAAGPVDLIEGPNGDLYYIAISTGTVHRIGYSAGNQPPVAVLSATPTSGPAPLAVAFDGRGSSDPDPGDTRTYAWDLDSDGQFDDSTSPNPSRTYSAAGPVTVRLRVTDGFGATDVAETTIAVGDTAPVPVIATPAAGTVASVGTRVSFSGSATDPQEGQLPASALTWTADIYHCSSPDVCHRHAGYATAEGVASGSFLMPDHERIAYIELTLTAVSGGESRSVVRRIDYRTTNLSFASNPPGVPISVVAASGTTPFSRTEHTGGVISVGAPLSVNIAGVPYAFATWSDGGAAAHDVTVPSSATTYTAHYRRTNLAAGSSLIRETFAGAASPEWTPLANAPAWSFCSPVAGNPQYCAAASVNAASPISARGDATWGNYTIDADVTLTQDRGGAAVLGRVQGPAAFYQLELRRVGSSATKYWTLYRRTPTAWVRLAEGPYNYPIGAPVRLRLDLRGTSLTASASANGGSTFTTLGTATDGAYLTGRVGLRAWETPATFDNVTVIAR